jgi:hypothetical protein
LFSELLYYLDAPSRASLVCAARRSLAVGGHLIAVRWRHHVPEHAADGDEVHRELHWWDDLLGIARNEEDDFLLDVFVRTDRVGPGQGERVRRAYSVAALEGLV